jgi:acyl-CoA thioesterase I
MRALGGMLALVLLPGFGLAGCGQQKAPDAQPSQSASATPQGQQVRIVALGDSLFAGYGLRAEQAYPVRLEAALRARGINASVVNAGVSGDTTQDGRARLDFTLGQGAKPDLVVLSLGGNDMLRGQPLAQTRENLDAILGELKKRGIKTVVMGMLAAPNMGADYAKNFNMIYPAIARKHHAALVPFFLRPIFGRPDLQLPDHIHPTDKGVEALVGATVETVAQALPKA